MKSSRTTAASLDEKRLGLKAHLDGWQPGLLAVCIAGVSAILAVPRSVPPSDIPEPMVAPREIDAILNSDASLARAAERKPLDADVRALGSALRAYNLADTTDDVQAVGQERRAVAEAAVTAMNRPDPGMKNGASSIAKLRAYQLGQFLRELKRWEATGIESDELREMGGPFLQRAQKNGWIEGHKLLPNDAVRAVLFKKRWIELTMLQSDGLELAPVEQRTLIAFLLRNPPRDPSRAQSFAKAGASRADHERFAAARVAAEADQYRLKKIEELRAIDPSYPADLALGVILYRANRFPLSVEAFRRHLDAHPDGPYAIRAQNYLRAAIERASDIF